MTGPENLLPEERSRSWPLPTTKAGEWRPEPGDLTEPGMSGRLPSPLSLVGTTLRQPEPHWGCGPFRTSTVRKDRQKGGYAEFLLHTTIPCAFPAPTAMAAGETDAGRPHRWHQDPAPPAAAASVPQHPGHHPPCHPPAAAPGTSLPPFSQRMGDSRAPRPQTRSSHHQ